MLKLADLFPIPYKEIKKFIGYNNKTDVSVGKK